MIEVDDAVLDGDLDEQSESAKAEWLSFKLAGLDYAVDILRVQEIRVWQESTRIPYAPKYVVGLINLRGAIVPIVDLRLRLGLEPKSYDEETVILIMDVELNEGPKTIGIIVDAISEVVQTDLDNSQLSPEFDLAIDQSFVSGITEDQDHMVILLKVDTLLDLDI